MDCYALALERLVVAAHDGPMRFAQGNAQMRVHARNSIAWVNKASSSRESSKALSTPRKLCARTRLQLHTLYSGQVLLWCYSTPCLDFSFQDHALKVRTLTLPSEARCSSLPNFNSQIRESAERTSPPQVPELEPSQLPRDLRYASAAHSRPTIGGVL